MAGTNVSYVPCEVGESRVCGDDGIGEEEAAGDVSRLRSRLRLWPGEVGAAEQREVGDGQQDLARL